MATEAIDPGLVLAEIQRNQREVIRVTRRLFAGHQIVDLRNWYRAGDGELRPTSKGIAFRLDLLPEVLEALTIANRPAPAEPDASQRFRDTATDAMEQSTVRDLIGGGQ
jgi:hypothetical protein